MIRPVCAHCGETVEVRVVLDTSKLAAEVRRELKPDLEKIMTDQEHLDQDVQQLGAGIDAIAAEIDQLKSQPGGEALDFTGLDAAVARVQGLAPAAPPADGDTSGDSGEGEAPAV